MPASADQRTITLHIGTEKTGTTTLQTLGDENRALLARHGLCYPRTPGDINHMGLTIFAMEPDRVQELHAAMRLHGEAAVADYRDTFLASLKAEIDAGGESKILLSNEHLSSRIRKPAQLHRLVEGLKSFGYALRVLIYLRPQHELIVSSWSTSVKSGNTNPIRLDQGEGNFFFNYDKMLALWESAIGIANIDVRLFSKDRFHGGTLVSDFFDALGMGVPPGLVIPDDRNRALDAETVEFLRVANETFPRMVNGRIDQDRIRMLNVLEAISTGPRITVDPESLARIDREFTGSNTRVARRYFPESDAPLFPPYQAKDGVPPRPLSAERAVEIAVALWKHRKR